MDAHSDLLPRSHGAERHRMARYAQLWSGRGKLLIVLPLLLFLALNFVVPISLMLLRAIEDPELPAALPQTTHLLAHWDGTELPPSNLVAVFCSELREAEASDKLAEVANRLNFDTAGLRTLLFRTARHTGGGKGSIDALKKIDPRWGERETWLALKRASGGFTSFYLLASVDLRRDTDGNVVSAPPERSVFVAAMERTLWISAMVMFACLILGYPVAYLLANLPERTSNLLMILVLLPFWTSILVRTTAWIVLLQTHGVVNDALMAVHAVAHPLALVYNRVGVYVAMTHVLLPYAILPLYAVMKGIQPAPLRAALSLGGSPGRVFWIIYAPQTLPGVVAGGFIVFVLSLGYYITPALVGGPRDQMISYFIAYYTNQSPNWGMAAALSLVLLGATLALMFIGSRLIPGRRLEWRA